MDIHSSDFAKTHGQKFTAETLGITVGAVSQMVNSHRQIFIKPTPAGYEAYETKVIGRKRA